MQSRGVRGCHIPPLSIDYRETDSQVTGYKEEGVVLLVSLEIDH